jgi:hypothetical protein
VTVFLGGGEERVDILVGADGLRSKTGQPCSVPRSPATPDTRSDGPWWSWRSRERSFRRGVTGFESWGRGARFGCAHIGKGRVYWFATDNAPKS